MPKKKVDIYDPKVRGRLEGEYAAAIARFFAKQKKRIISVIVAGGLIDWEEENKLLADAVGYIAFDRVMLAAMNMFDDLPPGIEIPTVHEAALRWLHDYKFGGVGKLGEITRGTEKVVRAAIADFISTPGMTIGDLQQVLISSGKFDTVRASRIAITETTRAFAEGENIVADEYQKMGIPMLDTWESDNDQLVCDNIAYSCAELHGQKVKHGELFYPPDNLGSTGYPPRHINCRCRVTHEQDR